MSVSNSFFKAVNAVKSKLNPRQVQASAVPQIAADPALMQMLSEILSSEGIASSWQGSYLSLPEGLVLAAEPVEVVNLAEDKFRTCTRIHVSHASLFPQGLSEYQHAMGSTEMLALTEGFRTWVRMDLLVLLDATRESPKDCTVIEMNIASEADLADGKPMFRQVILGPVAHLASLPEPKKKEEHPFCPCCLFTESMPAFHEVLQTSHFLGVRLFASRDNEGQLAADCRVNGEDFLPAVEHLKQYAGKWPDRGLEFRKQYIVIRSSSNSVNQVANAQTG
ncbi:DUF6348 family protein [Undibacterium sp. TS12]|uniref:DUF6348 family protein n=1 Tax=Undibacterium sp. TS12 TaxID=2908202 RepID=UPI001F4CEEDE|nr:DUF6348 family protein [Undibacterium sp. TS12]MCH8619963.1 DUF6348 family protein [Undibacterium sp. TS12]